jgi:hypothetical protein
MFVVLCHINTFIVHLLALLKNSKICYAFSGSGYRIEMLWQEEFQARSLYRPNFVCFKTVPNPIIDLYRSMACELCSMSVFKFGNVVLLNVYFW